MSITAKELAKKLNLSAAAVSMALNNKPGVSTDTRRRILDAADRYGYDFTRITEKQNAAGTILILSSIKSTARSSMTRRFFHNFPRGSPTPASSPGIN